MCCIGGADISIVFKLERLNKAISVERIYGTPEGSNITLDGNGSICIFKCTFQCTSLITHLRA